MTKRIIRIIEKWRDRQHPNDWAARFAARDIIADIALATKTTMAPEALRDAVAAYLKARDKKFPPRLFADTPELAAVRAAMKGS